MRVCGYDNLGLRLKTLSRMLFSGRGEKGEL